MKGRSSILQNKTSQLQSQQREKLIEVQKVVNIDLLFHFLSFYCHILSPPLVLWYVLILVTEASRTRENGNTKQNNKQKVTKQNEATMNDRKQQKSEVAESKEVSLVDPLSCLSTLFLLSSRIIRHCFSSLFLLVTSSY